MGRKPARVRFVKRTIKLTLHPLQHQRLIEMIDNAPHKGRLIIDALEGRSHPEPAEGPANADDELRDQLADFMM